MTTEPVEPQLAKTEAEPSQPPPLPEVASPVVEPLPPIVEPPPRPTIEDPWPQLRNHGKLIDDLFEAIRMNGLYQDRVAGMDADIRSLRARSTMHDEALRGMQDRGHGRHAPLDRLIDLEQLVDSTRDQLDRLKQIVASQDKRIAKLEHDYHRLIAAERPVDGVVTSNSARPSPDVLLSRLEQLEAQQWKGVLDAVMACIPPDTATNKLLLRVAVAHILTRSLFVREPVETNTSFAIGHLKGMRIVLDGAVEAQVRALAESCKQLLDDVDASEPRSGIVVPSLVQGQRYDPKKFKAHVRSPDGPNAQMRFLVFPGYRTETRDYLLPQVFNE